METRHRIWPLFLWLSITFAWTAYEQIEIRSLKDQAENFRYREGLLWDEMHGYPEVTAGGMDSIYRLRQDIKRLDEACFNLRQDERNNKAIRQLICDSAVKLERRIAELEKRKP